MQLLLYATCFKELLLTDLRAFKSIIIDKLIDLGIWVITTVAVTSYLFPAFGMSPDFGPFTLVGLCASAGLFEVFPSIMALISDFENDQVIAYYVTLPMPSWLVFMRSVVYYAICSMVLGLFTLPIGNLFLQNPIAYTQIHIPKFLFMISLISIFYGAFIIFVASYVKDMLRIGSVWMRIVYPLWFLGGFQFSWKGLHEISPILAYINLFNPLTYCMEGIRATVLDPSDYLPFWFCALMLMLFTVLCTVVGIMRLKKRLDFI